MAVKSRVLKTVFALPITAALAVFLAVGAHGFELKPDTDDTDYPTYDDTVKTTANLADGDSIIIDGTPTDASKAALLVDNSDTNVVLDGQIRIRDRTSDTASEGTGVTLTDAYGVHITSSLTGDQLRLKAGGDIYIIEIRGPGYDGDDDDSLPDSNTCGDGVDRDTDDDGIIEGAPACGTHNRIGLWVDAEMGVDNNLVSQLQYSLIGENGSSIIVDGNTVTSGNVAGVKIDNVLAGHLDLSTAITVHGDQARGVYINNTIGGNYRQRGNVDVRGEGTVAIDITERAEITGSLMIEGNINATGYSAYSPTSVGAPRRGGADFDDDDDDEFSTRQVAANSDERRQSRAAVEIGAAVAGGVIINGPVNRVRTRDEQRDFSCKVEDEDCDADGITERRSDGLDVSGDKTLPYHYDENRSSARLTSHGESEATLLISANIGTSGGSTKETFLDTTDDDNDAGRTPNESGDNEKVDFYDSTQEFFYSHGLINRGTILADGLYDSVNPQNAAPNYPIDRPATAVKLNNNAATIYGGIFNSGTISATAYNADATAIDLQDGILTDGVRDDNIIMLNEGTISARIETHEKSYVDTEADSRAAIAVKIDNAIDYLIYGAIPQFTNAGSVSATSIHRQDSGDTNDDGDVIYETVTGDNALAFDLSAITGNFNLTQQMRAAEMVLDASAVNGSTYFGSGDTDIDRAGDTTEIDGSTVTIGDGKIDTRDVTAPSISGDVKFGGGNNIFTVMAGSVVGLIDFGAGLDEFKLGNSMADDANNVDDEDDDYTAPITTFQGRIKRSGTISNSDTLTIMVGGQDDNIAAERTRLHFVGQEGRDTNGDGLQDEENEGFAINTLTLNEAADLRFTINPGLLDDEVLDVTMLTLSASATISPFITTLINEDKKTLKLVKYDPNNLTDDSGVALADRLPEDGHAFIYNVTLKDEDNIISAEFGLKTPSDIGLNANESASYDAVIDHFRTNERLEAAITAISDKDVFKNAYGQLLPHYGDGTMRQLSGLADAATGAVGQHLQIAGAGGRRGDDGWAQQFGDYRRQDGSGQTDHISGTSYGLAAGYDGPVGPLDALGLYAQMSFTSVHEKPVPLSSTASPNTDEVKAESFVVGAYLADRIGPLSYELNAAVGSVAFDSVRGVNFNNVIDVLRGSWDGISTAASARLAYPLFEHRHLLRLEAGFDHFALEQDGYRERADTTSFDSGLAMQLGRAESDMTSQFIGLRGGYRSGGGSPSDIVWEPNYYIGYRSVSDATPYSARANFIGSTETFTLQSQDDPTDSVDIGFGMAAHNDYFAFEFNYRGKYGDDEEMHGGGISIRLLF